jgi:hypothetical protein
MAKKGPAYEEITAIAVKAYGRTSKSSGADVEGQAGCYGRCSSCKSECGSDCQDYVSNAAATSGAFAGAIVGAQIN